MLYTFGFDRSCIVVGDVFFIDPKPRPGQEGAEAGVRAEIRRLERPPLRGSVYASQPIAIAEPIARFDLFESFPGGKGTRDRVHYHPNMEGWEPGHRVFDVDMTANPVEWLYKRLVDAPRFFDLDEVDDAAAIAARADEVVGRVEELWNEVRAGSLDPPEGWTGESTYRRGWL
jgi:hypothetical protein